MLGNSVRRGKLLWNTTSNLIFTLTYINYRTVMWSEVVWLHKNGFVHITSLFVKFLTHLIRGKGGVTNIQNYANVTSQDTDLWIYICTNISNISC